MKTQELESLKQRFFSILTKLKITEDELRLRLSKKKPKSPKTFANNKNLSS